MNTRPSIIAINRSQGGVPKRPVPEALVSAAGLEGDQQRNLKHHGGPDRALCLYSAELISALAAEGHPIYPGAIGENLTITGLDWAALTPGVRLRLGPEVLCEITNYAPPCRTISGAFADERSARVSQKVHPGESRVYARVLREGRVRAGDEVELLAEEA
jgi:MOSC domain-containing protein YiiM